MKDVYIFKLHRPKRIHKKQIKRRFALIRLAIDADAAYHKRIGEYLADRYPPVGEPMTTVFPCVQEKA